MRSNPDIRRSPGRRAVRAAAFSSTAAIGSVTIAGGASAAVLFLAILGSLLGLNGSIFQWLQPILAAASFSTVGSSKPVTPPPASLPVEEPAAQPDASAGAGGKREMKLGINVVMPSYYSNFRAFSNLILQSPWWLVTSSGASKMPNELLDGNQNLVKLDAGQKAYRVISPPTRALQGVSVDIVCHWSGKAKVSFSGPPTKNARISANSATFTYVPGASATQSGEYRALFHISELDVANPIRDIDCREADANPDTVFDAAFVAEVSRYNSLRYMKWQTAVEQNTPIRWADRSKPTSNAPLATTDGVSVEQMVRLANEAQTNPWFCMPWNADDEYIRKFAEYVRDHLDPRLVVYVETSNEVWNWTYKVTVQARNEGRTRNLANDDGTALLYRYAERTGEVMDIWRSAFASNPKRLIRVAATQNAVPWATGKIVNYKDTASKIDALATAPYFGWTFKAGEVPPANFFSTVMPDEMDRRLKSATESKALAAEKGLRFITYEAGQHITAASVADVPIQERVQRDPRMGDLYTRYLTKWNNEFGDLMVLFAAWGSISQHGAWGMQEYQGQPLSEAPKAQAVDRFSRSYVTKN